MSEPESRTRPPRWLLGVAALVCIAAGLALTFRPTASLDALVILLGIALAGVGVAEIAGATRIRPRWLSAATGVVFLTGAAVVVAWPGATLAALAPITAVTLIVGGIVKALSGIRGEDHHAAAAGTAPVASTAAGAASVSSIAAGAASVIFGIVALSWPDATLLALAVLTGPVVVLFGFATGIRVLRPSTHRRHGVAAVASVLALVVALGSLALSVRLNSERFTAPDSFYAAPADVPDTPGVLLRSEPWTADGIPEGTRAWRILYTTTRDEGVPAIASGVVVLPAAGSPEPLPVLAWAHGTTGVAPKCAPSLSQEPYGTADAILAEATANGWAVVATDYVGLGTEGPHPYLIGQGQGRSVLDSVRAAHQLELALDERTVVWGHSQGGNAALWTGILGPTYAPDVQIAGVAALSPATDLRGLVGYLAEIAGGAIFASYVADAYSRTYPDVDFATIVAPEAQTLAREDADRCLGEGAIAVSVGTALAVPDILAEGQPDEQFLRRLAENTPEGPIDVPVLIGQGAADPLILESVQTGFVAKLCEQPRQIDYRTYPGADHNSVIAADSPLVPELVEWTGARFDGAPAGDECGPIPQ